MPLTPSSLKRLTDASGDDVLTFLTAGGKQAQGVALVDEFGNLVPPNMGTNNVAVASATLTYVGQESAAGTWLVMRIDTTTGTVITYAGLVNNGGVATYAAAWAGRGGLTYGLYSEAL